jgi:hypothetical protein
VIEDIELDCNHGCGKVPHRFRPSPEAGPHWRCSECGSVTVRIEDVLEYLHASGETADDASRQDQHLDRLLDDLDGMFDVASLGALARNFHGVEPPPSPYAGVCNEILEKVEPSRVSTLMLMSLVRFTCGRRGMLPAWYQLRDDAVVQLRGRLPDRWKALMTGLLEHQP